MENPPNFTTALSQQAYERLRRHISAEDQPVLVELLHKIDERNGLAMRHAGELLPHHLTLIALLIEQHKELALLRQEVEGRKTGYW